jgi:hypothetical protein
MALLLLLSCLTEGEPRRESGWRETTPPRADMQCWVRWSQPNTTVCAPALNSTHGAAL